MKNNYNNKATTTITTTVAAPPHKGLTSSHEDDCELENHESPVQLKQ